jgi:hypothetical protein
MVQHFRNEDAKWCSFYASSPEALGLEDSSRIEEAEVSGRDEGQWCITYPSVSEAINKKIDLFRPEAMVQYLWNEKSELCSFDASSPEAAGLEGSWIEEAEVPVSNEGEWCTNYSSAPEAMPKKTGDSKPVGETDS